MDKFHGISWVNVVAREENESFFIYLDGGTADVEIEARSRDGVIINAITTDGETIFLAEGSVVKVSERLSGCASIEIVGSSAISYRCVVQQVLEFEILDPKPAVVVERLTERDQIAIAVREEVERRLGTLRDMGVFKDELNADELLEDVLKGDHEFEEDEEDFVSMSYEDLAEERVTPEDGIPEGSTAGPPAAPTNPEPAPSPATPPEPS